jgi:hypothetical protein
MCPGKVPRAAVRRNCDELALILCLWHSFAAACFMLITPPVESSYIVCSQVAFEAVLSFAPNIKAIRDSQTLLPSLHSPQDYYIKV